MRCKFGFTTDLSSPLSFLIRRVTGGDKSHALMVFDNGSDHPFYFESIVKKDKDSKKNGVRGPIDLNNLLGWQAENPKYHKVSFLPAAPEHFLPFTDEECEKAFDTLAAAVRTVKYARHQIIQNWIASRFKIVLSLRKASRYKWHCSETCMRQVPPRYWPYYDIGNVTFDFLVPDGNKLASLYDGTVRLINEKGSRIKEI